MQCSYGGREIAASIDPSVPVECPQCGAIRIVPRRGVWDDMFVFPVHKEVEGGARARRCYRLHVSGNWEIVNG